MTWDDIETYLEVNMGSLRIKVDIIFIHFRRTWGQGRYFDQPKLIKETRVPGAGHKWLEPP